MFDFGVLESQNSSNVTINRIWKRKCRIWDHRIVPQVQRKQKQQESEKGEKSSKGTSPRSDVPARSQVWDSQWKIRLKPVNFTIKTSAKKVFMSWGSNLEKVQTLKNEKVDFGATIQFTQFRYHALLSQLIPRTSKLFFTWFLYPSTPDLKGLSIWLLKMQISLSQISSMNVARIFEDHNATTFRSDRTAEHAMCHVRNTVFMPAIQYGC